MQCSDEFQIEREKADLSVQVISLSERLEESEGGVESHVKLIFFFDFNCIAVVAESFYKF